MTTMKKKSILIYSFAVFMFSLSIAYAGCYDSDGGKEINILGVACHDFCPLLLTGHMSAF